MNIAAATPVAVKPPTQPVSLVVAFDEPKVPRTPGMSRKELLEATRAAGLAVQAPAAKVLDGLKAEGIVQDYRQLWLVGVMSVQTTEANVAAVRDALLGLKGVQAIEVDRPVQIQPENG